MVESIASTPVATGLSVSDFRPGHAGPDSGSSQSDTSNSHSKVPPPKKADAPAPVPPEVSGSQSFAAALVAQHIPQNSITPTELQLRMGGTWQVPDSPLRLTDRTI